MITLDKTQFPINELGFKYQTWDIYSNSFFCISQKLEKKNQRLLMSKMSAVKTFLVSLSKTDPAKASVAKFVCLFFFLVDNGKFEQWSGG